MPNRMLLGLAGAAEYETAFFNHIRPHLDVEAPEGLFCSYDPDPFNTMSILKDLSDHVTEFCDHPTVIDRPHTESQMRLLAKMHGTGYVNDSMRSGYKYFLP